MTNTTQLKQLHTMILVQKLNKYILIATPIWDPDHVI